MYQQLRLLVAVLLCSVLALATPATLNATPKTVLPSPSHTIDQQHPAGVAYAPGEVSSGEAAGMLQKVDKALLAPLLKQALQDFYFSYPIAGAAPAYTSCFVSGSPRFSILTKGP